MDTRHAISSAADCSAWPINNPGSEEPDALRRIDSCRQSLAANRAVGGINGTLRKRWSMVHSLTPIDCTANNFHAIR
jgi:hypothetical protein